MLTAVTHKAVDNLLLIMLSYSTMAFSVLAWIDYTPATKPSKLVEEVEKEWGGEVKRLEESQRSSE